VKWIALKVVYESRDPSFAADMISSLFYDLGCQGVVLEDPEYETGDGWADESVIMPEEYAVVGYLQQDQYTAETQKAIQGQLDRLEQEDGIVSRVAAHSVDQQDWAETWKAHFQPTKITSRITVKPTWRDYVKQPGEIVIELDPGMAFGTGTHPTSGLCIQMIERHLKPGGSFLDIGTGSGILMIAAANLGAEKGVGIDLDEDALEISRSNLILNGVDTDMFTLRHGDLIGTIHQRFDLVVANILPGAILMLLDDIEKVLAPRGVFVCSGILREHTDSVTEKMVSGGFDISDVREEDTWVAIAGRL